MRGILLAITAFGFGFFLSKATKAKRGKECPHCEKGLVHVSETEWVCTSCLYRCYTPRNGNTW